MYATKIIIIMIMIIMMMMIIKKKKKEDNLEVCCICIKTREILIETTRILYFAIIGYFELFLVLFQNSRFFFPFFTSNVINTYFQLVQSLLNNLDDKQVRWGNSTRSDSLQRCGQEINGFGASFHSCWRCCSWNSRKSESQRLLGAANITILVSFLFFWFREEGERGCGPGG